MKSMLALIRREFWENKGAIRTTPLVIGAMVAVLLLIKLLVLAASAVSLVMAAGYLRNVAQVTWIGKPLEHFYGLDDMIINFKPLLQTQRAPSDLEIVHLSPVVEMFRLVEREAPWVVRFDMIYVTSGDEMFVPV